MSFWLHESLVTTYLRGLTRQTRILITLSCVAAVVGVTWARKHRPSLPQVTQEQVLRKALNQSSSKRSKSPRKAGSIRVALNTQALPQTLQFFTDAGFYVCNVEQLLRPRSKQVIGYAVRVRGSFETLLKFLTALKSAPAAHLLRLQSVDRIDESKLAIEFLIRGAQI